ncbi:hypothetical protein RUE5091_01917 [Ruegeria denitrificans]|uniref:Uncharacterized protein n=1 Tax=Ruegeria denitrificans TaxID=1715692 RepID=A0A0P1I8Z0_9RHOB|nr:hypothetical protein RUE5091_01917 [Ruegeria denitrificans]
MVGLFGRKRELVAQMGCDVSNDLQVMSSSMSALSAVYAPGVSTSV